MSELVPGFRFYPTEEALVSFYLFHKLRANVKTSTSSSSSRSSTSTDTSHGNCPENWARYAGETWSSGSSSCRGRRGKLVGEGSYTPAGYWKAIGSPSYIYSTDNRVIGLKKTMNVQKTKWKMNEYRAIHEERAGAAVADESSDAAVPKVRYEYSLCRVYVVSGNFPGLRPKSAGSCSDEEYKWVDADEGNFRRPVVGVGDRDGHRVRLGTTDWAQQPMNN